MGKEDTGIFEKLSDSCFISGRCDRETKLSNKYEENGILEWHVPNAELIYTNSGVEVGKD